MLPILYSIYTKEVRLLQLGKKWLVFDISLLKRTIAYGWASAMQQATVQLGKLGIQMIVNTMGVSVVAAFMARQIELMTLRIPRNKTLLTL